MLKSMTGYGSTTVSINNYKLVIQLKSVNSKSFDLNLKLGQNVKPFESEIRTILASSIERGKVECYLAFEENNSETGLDIKKVEKIYNEISLLTNQNPNLNLNLLGSILQMPNFQKHSSMEDGITEEQWLSITPHLNHTISLFNGFRENEGMALIKDILEKINSIASLAKSVEDFEGERISNMREKLLAKLNDLKIDASFDKNRLEQELIYYLEKFDITEEKVRLKTHCDYFIETVNTTDTNNGRKLGFISQEIGREINTMGSKANHAEIQKIVVKMKDELEKIKEQLLNVL